jgi:hypothetical protein
MIISNDGRFESDDPKLITFHGTRDSPRKVICVKDNPFMKGFGKTLKAGDVVEINGTIHEYFGFAVSVPAECAFYDYTHFELFEKENKNG